MELLRRIYFWAALLLLVLAALDLSYLPSRNLGKDLSLLSEPGRVVLLRELGYPHQGKYAWFITLDGSRHWWTRREAREALFNPELPGKESCRFYGETSNGMLVWLFLALLLALGYCALNAWAKRR